MIAYLAVWVSAILPLSAQKAFAQPQPLNSQPHRMVDVYPGVQITGLAILPNADSLLGIEQIEATPPEAFRELPHGERAVSDPTWDRSLWLKITLHAHGPVANQLPSSVSILEIQKPYLDQVTLYTPTVKAGERWQVQRAGDFLAKELWSLPGQFPRFILPTLSELQALPGGQMVAYLHVPHRIPASFDVKVWSAAQLMANIQSDYVLLGITYGSMLLAVLLSIALLVFHRDQLFVWYAAYASSALLASLSHSGLAFQYLWPWGGMWPSNAVLCFALVAAAAQLQFCKLMFMPSKLRTWRVVLCEWLGGVSVVAALVLALVSREFWTPAIFVSQAFIVASMLLSTSLITSAWRRGNKLAMAVAPTYLPLFVAVVLAMGNAQGFIWLPEIGYNAPLYAVALEVALLALCL